MFLALIYRILYKLHHWLFLKPGRPLAHAKLIVVGSFLAGGAGKTPFTIWLANHIVNLYQNKKVAVLCHARAQDEFQLLKAKLPWATVVATSNRYRTAQKLDNDFDYILCDDGFEDSRLRPFMTIRLDWGKPPCGLGDLLPSGPYRSLPQDHSQPDLVLRCDGENPDVTFSIAEIVNGLGERFETSVGKEKSTGAVAICGIGNPERFLLDLKFFGVDVLRMVVRPDHDSHFETAVRKLLKDAPNVILTEKDAVRLGENLKKSPFVYRCLQKVEVRSEKVEKII
jgi:tetraacyldisaccharide 4'-kinase